MKVYILSAESNVYENLVFAKEKDLELLEQFEGSVLGAPWKKPRVRVIRDSGPGVHLAPGDFPSLASHVPVFSAAALQVLGKMLLGNGEILPLLCKDGEYWAYNVTRLADALDESRSVIERFQTSGRVMDIVEHFFVGGKLSGLTIFKIPQAPLMNVYVTDAFVELVEAEGLKGFEFKHVWTG